MEEKFELKALKIGASGVDVKYILTETDGVESTEKTYHVTDSRPCHADLRDGFDKGLAGVIAEMVGTDRNRIVVSGISFAGSEENAGVVITAEMNTEYGRIRIKTPRIKFLQDTQIGPALTVLIRGIQKEVASYLFVGKTADVEVFE